MIVNGVMWDKTRSDHLISKKELKNLKQPAMIIDVSADEGGAIETSKATTFSEPTYIVDGVIHYVVVHTPTIFHSAASESISVEVAKYLDALLEEKTEENDVLAESIIIKDGSILDEKIKASLKNVVRERSL